MSFRGERALHIWIYVDGWWNIQLTCVCPILLINRRTVIFQNFVTGSCAVVVTRTFWNYLSEHPDTIALAFETSIKINKFKALGSDSIFHLHFLLLNLFKSVFIHLHLCLLALSLMITFLLYFVFLL